MLLAPGRLLSRRLPEWGVRSLISPGSLTPRPSSRGKTQALQTLVTEFQKEQQKSAIGTAVFLPPLFGTEEHQSATTDGSGDGGGQGCHASAATTPTAVAAAASVVQRAASS